MLSGFRSNVALSCRRKRACRRDCVFARFGAAVPSSVFKLLRSERKPRRGAGAALRVSSRPPLQQASAATRRLSSRRWGSGPVCDRNRKRGGGSPGGAQSKQSRSLLRRKPQEKLPQQRSEPKRLHLPPEFLNCLGLHASSRWMSWGSEECPWSPHRPLSKT